MPLQLLCTPAAQKRATYTQKSPGCNEKSRISKKNISKKNIHVKKSSPADALATPLHISSSKEPSIHSKETYILKRAL